MLVQYRTAGFSLVELLVVVSLIAMLSVAGINSYSTAAAEARDAKRIADMEAIGQALELFYQDHGRYPGACDGIMDAGASNVFPGEIIGDDGPDTPNTIEAALAPYLGTIPQDPMADRNPGSDLLFFYSYDPDHMNDGCDGSDITQVVTYGFNYSETGIDDRETCVGGDMNLDNASYNRILTPPSNSASDC